MLSSSVVVCVSSVVVVVVIVIDYHIVAVLVVVVVVAVVAVVVVVVVIMSISLSCLGLAGFCSAVCWFGCVGGRLAIGGWLVVGWVGMVGG